MKTPRTTLKVLAWVLATPCLSVSLALASLLLPSVRDVVAEQAVRLVNQQGDFRLHVERLERIDPWGVDVRGISLRDVTGRVRVDIGYVSLRIAPFSLLGDELLIRRLAVSQVRGTLRRVHVGGEKNGAADAQQESGADKLRVRVSMVALDDVRLDVAGYPPLSYVEVLALRAAFAWSEVPWIFLSQADLTIEGETGRLLRLRTRESNWDAESGGLVRLSGELADAPIEITGQIGAIETKRIPRGQVMLSVRKLQPHAFDRFGLAAADVHVPIGLELRATSEGEHVDAHLGVSTSKGRANVRARGQPRELTANVYAQSADLSEISGVLPALSVYGTVEGQARLTPDATELHARWRYVAIQGVAVPDGQIDGSYEGDLLRVNALHVAGFERELIVHGSYNLRDASVDLDVLLDDLDLRKAALGAEPIAGRVNGRARIGVSPFGQIGGEVALSVRKLKAGALSAGHARFGVVLEGTSEEPRVFVEASARPLSLGGARLTAFSLHGEGDARRARGELETRADGFNMNTTFRGENLRGRAPRFQALGRGRARGLPIELEARGQFDKDSGESALAVFVGSLQNRLTAHGALDRRQRVHGQIDVDLARLAAFSRVLPGLEPSGSIVGQIAVDGPMSAPSFQVSLTGDALRVQGSPELGAQLAAQGSLERGDVTAELRCFTREPGAWLSLQGEAHVNRRRRGGELDFENVTHRAQVEAHVPLALLAQQAGPDLSGLSGQVDLTMVTSGHVSAPVMHTVLEGELEVPSEDLQPEVFRMVVDADTQRASLRANAQDQIGELLKLEGEARWEDVRRMIRGLSSVKLPAFHLQGTLSPRRLDRMQGALAYLTRAYEVDVPVRVGAELDISGQDDLIEGAALANVVVHADALDPNCALGASSEVALGLDFKGTDIAAHLNAKTNAGGAVSGALVTRVMVDKTGVASPRLEVLELKAQGQGIELAKLPGLCDLTSGRAGFVMKGRVGVEEEPELLLELGLEDVQAEDGEPLSVELAAKIDARALEAEGQLVAARRQVGRLNARVPLALDAKTLRARVDRNAPMQVSMRLQKLPLAPILSFGEGLGRPRGTASGVLELSGTMASPRPKMDLRLSGVGFSIARMAQPLRDIEGRILLRGKRLRIEGLTAHDRSGRARLDGRAMLKRDGSGRANLQLETDEFPLRRQGEVIAELSTKVVATAEMDEALRLKTDVFIKGGRLWVTGARGRAVQALDAHPDIRFADEEKKESVEEKKTKLAVSLSDLRVRTEGLVWVMHRDFSVQVSIDVRLEEQDGPKLTGGVEIRRGNLQLLGRSFEIERGVVGLTGDFPPDPQIDLRAVYKTRQGDELFVTLSGRSSAPALTFSGAASTPAEAMALLTGSNRAGAETEAQTDARNFAATLTAGLLSVAVREELGDWVPVIIIESDETGAPTRGRAGFEASKLIPRFLRPIAKGAYVEGIVGTTDQVGGSVGIGARLEISFPYDFLTSTGYGPGPTWAADLLWAP